MPLTEAAPADAIASGSALGEDTVDTYLLRGFAEALAHARREYAAGAPTN